MASGGKNTVHSCGPGKLPVYDLWLDKHQAILQSSRDTPILDLGCGYGNDSLYLAERGYRTVSCDKKIKAVENVRCFVPSAKTFLFDMRDELPFEEKTFRVVIADLSLHYFPWGETIRIVRNISVILQDGGFLLCRLNSVNDFHFGAGQGEEIEPHYYRIDGLTKRFFDRAQIEALFSNWDIKQLGEYELNRYRNPKMLWELVLQKR